MGGRGETSEGSAGAYEKGRPAGKSKTSGKNWRRGKGRLRRGKRR